MDRIKWAGALEALLFATDRPLTRAEMAEVLTGAPDGAIDDALEELQRRYAAAAGGLRIQQVAGGFRIATRPEYAESIRALFRSRNRLRLSPAALETLALIAYRQPVTAVELVEMRGSCSSTLLHNLLERKLIRIAGRKAVVGRPILYATGAHFLTHFGLDRIEDLPRLDEVETGGGDDSEALPADLPVAADEETGTP